MVVDIYHETDCRTQKDQVTQNFTSAVNECITSSKDQIKVTMWVGQEALKSYQEMRCCEQLIAARKCGILLSAGIRPPERSFIFYEMVLHSSFCKQY